MSEPFVYDPRCILCKDPFGAVTCSTAVTFRCRPLTVITARIPAKLDRAKLFTD